MVSDSLSAQNTGKNVEEKTDEKINDNDFQTDNTLLSPTLDVTPQKTELDLEKSVNRLHFDLY